MLRVNVRTEGTSKYTIDGSDKEVDVFCVGFGGRVPSESRGGELYRSVHEACLEIASMSCAQAGIYSRN